MKRVTKKEFRSTTSGIFYGVCAGIAEYFNISVVAVRILWFLSILCYGFGLGLYIILAIALPGEK